MNNPIELRGYQVMINEIDSNKTKYVLNVKWLLYVAAFGFLIHFPDVIGHGILWILHIIYEAISYLLEEFLIHTFGFDKPSAQLIVFYFNLVVGVSGAVLFWRKILKNYLVLKLYTYKRQVIDSWYSKGVEQKIKSILLYSSLTISAYMFLLT